MLSRMFRNYLAAALRNLLRNRFYTAINIVGLAVGFAAALLIALFVRDELSFDRFFAAHERVYRVYAIGKPPVSALSESNTTERGVDEWLPLEFHGVERVASLVTDKRSVRQGDLEVEEEIGWTTAQFFEIFRPPGGRWVGRWLIAGDPVAALSKPDGVVLTRTLARKYFGRDDAVGGVIEIDRKFPLRVGAVIEDLPSNTHLKLGIVAVSSAPFARKDWGATYVRLAPGVSPAQIERGMRGAIDRRMPFQTVVAGNQTLHWRWTQQMLLLPIASVHLHRESTAGQFDPSPDLRTLGALAGIGVLIVLVAIINFVNIMTARAHRRGVEVGIRKVAGARRADLVVQFIGESLVYVLIGLACAVSLVELLLPTFNAFLDRGVEIDALAEPGFAFAVAAVALAAGALGGLYPAFVLSAFRPALVFKGIAGPGGAGRVRQSLVVVQYAVLIGLLVAAAVIYRQTVFAMNEALRLDKDQVVLIRTSCAQSLLDQIRELRGVRFAGCSSSAPLSLMGRSGGSLEGAEAIPFEMNMVGFGFFETYGLHPLAGRVLDARYATDSIRAGDEKAGSSVLINDELRRKLGLKSAADAIGKSLQHARPLPGAPPAVVPGEIVGVVPDFPIGDINTRIPPALFYVQPDFFRLMSVKLSGESVPATLEAIGRVWRRAGEARPIDLFFFDQHTQQLYAQVRRMGTLVALAAAVAVFIACLGLLGLATYIAERRRKEVGIRKASGAGPGDILRLMLWELLRPVVWANVVAWPAAYLILSRWLDGIAYHVELGIGVFGAAGLATVLIALATVALQAARLARTPPATSLRYE